MLRHVSIHRAEDEYIKNEFCERLFSDISKLLNYLNVKLNLYYDTCKLYFNKAGK